MDRDKVRRNGGGVKSEKTLTYQKNWRRKEYIQRGEKEMGRDGGVRVYEREKERRLREREKRRRGESKLERKMIKQKSEE
uniref:Uncharacterized protein n=1 Tax=Octopus bimaculoides TaxID=37653 RepID=A0A0L8G1M1_OCTBM